MKTSHPTIIKLGTSTLTQGTKHLCRRHMLELVRQMAELHDQGKQLVIVSSGAMAAGREVLKNPKLDRLLPQKQMLASVGQVHLMQIWRDLFALFDIVVGQVLLTRGDVSDRKRYLNSRNTLHSLLKHRIIPIINENDTVATQEIRVGDNDNLSALVANLLAAETLILLTDQTGLFTADPRLHPEAHLIPVIEQIDDKIFALAGKPSDTLGQGTGGMITKIEAARLAAQSGTPTVIASSKHPNVLLEIAAGQKVGSRFLASISYRESRKRWLLSERPLGKILIDAGAEQKLVHGGSSLLPAGITQTAAPFDRGHIVTIATETHPVAVGIANYSSADIERIKGTHSEGIEDILGFSYGPEVIHRDNMTLLK
jgi:glutamate 5-kinase